MTSKHVIPRRATFGQCLPPVFSNADSSLMLGMTAGGVLGMTAGGDLPLLGMTTGRNEAALGMTE
jgi:hypothetical protein